MHNVDDHESTGTVRPSGPRPHQLRGSTPAGCEADRGPECRTEAAGCEQSRSGWTGGEPRSGEGASPPGAPGGLSALTDAVLAVASEVRGLREEIRTWRPGSFPPPELVEWSDLDVEHARRIHGAPLPRPLRPTENKTPRERAMLDRLRKTTGKEDEK